MIQPATLPEPTMAGTQLQSGLMLSGDDAAYWRAAGIETQQVAVYCSARIVAGDYTVPGMRARIAVDANGDYSHAAALLERFALDTVEPAVGHYMGATGITAVAEVACEDLERIHAELAEDLPGFGCFAVLV